MCFGQCHSAADAAGTALDKGVYGGFPKLGVLFWGSLRIIVFWVSILGSPCFGKLPYRGRGGGKNMQFVECGLRDYNSTPSEVYPPDCSTLLGFIKPYISSLNPGRVTFGGVLL